MELPWVLLVLAGTGTAAGLGDSRGRDRGLEGLRDVFLGGRCKVFVPGRGLRGWEVSPHRCCQLMGSRRAGTGTRGPRRGCGLGSGTC